MKQTTLLMLALAMGCSGAMAQSVVVVMKDGTQQKFGTDYVKEITFIEEREQQQPEPLLLMKTEPFGQGNVVLSFAPATEAYNVVLDMYGPYDAQYLNAGTYNVGTGGTAFTVGNDVKYSYIDFVEDSRGKVGFESGKAEVSMTEDYVYTIDMDFILTDGTKFRGTFTGEIPDYSPSKGVEIALSDAKYNDNPQKPGVFYVKFNDAAWSCEMAIDFVSKSDATVLPAGTYTYSAEGGEMTFSNRSYLDTYNPSGHFTFNAGTVTVTENAGTYTFDMDLTLDDGRNARITYSGEISGTPTFE